MVYETSVSTKAFFYYKNPAKNLNKQTMEVNIRRVEKISLKIILPNQWWHFVNISHCFWIDKSFSELNYGWQFDLDIGAKSNVRLFLIYAPDPRRDSRNDVLTTRAKTKRKMHVNVLEDIIMKLPWICNVSLI